MQSATASAGPSTANLGYGFDILAVALESPDLPRDRVTVEPAKRWEIVLEGPAGNGLPTGLKSNVAFLAARAVTRTPHRIRLWKGLPPGSGLGSSAASAAATVRAMAELHGIHGDLVAAAAEGERASAGAPHADNVGAALLGGLVCVADPPISWPIPRHIAFALAIPQIELTTRQMRRVVPKSWPRALHTGETARAIATALGLVRGEIAVLPIRGSVVEERRSRFIPNYRAVVRAAERADAPAVTISGSGPTMVAIVDSRKIDPDRVAKEMASAFRHSARAVVAFAGEGARIE